MAETRASGEAWDVGFDGHWRRQVAAGLALTHAQRLQWLEDTMAEMRYLLGRAAKVRPPQRGPNRPSG